MTVDLWRSLFTWVTSARVTRWWRLPPTHGSLERSRGWTRGVAPAGRGLRRETAEEEEEGGGDGRSERGLAGGSLGSGFGCTAAPQHGQARTGEPVLALPKWPAGC